MRVLIKDKRLFCVGIISILLMAGCQMNKTDFQIYLDALQKTQQIENGQMRQEIKITSRFYDEISFPENIELEFDTKFNEDKDQSITNIYFKNDLLGTDMSMYRIDNQSMYLKLMVSDLYYDLLSEPTNEAHTITRTEIEDQALFLTLYKEGRAIWISALNEKNVFRGDKMIIDSAFGDVKATQYTVTMTGVLLDEVKLAYRNLILAHKEALVLFINRQLSDESIDVDEFDQYINAYFESLTFKNFEYQAFVDADQYVIKTMINSQIHSSNLSEQTIEVMIENGEIAKKQKLIFPEINDGNIGSFPIEIGGVKNDID